MFIYIKIPLIKANIIKLSWILMLILIKYKHIIDNENIFNLFVINSISQYYLI